MTCRDAVCLSVDHLRLIENGIVVFERCLNGQRWSVFAWMSVWMTRREGSVRGGTSRS